MDKRKIFYLTMIFFVILSVFFVPLINSEQYYADINISVNEYGYVTIYGITNHPDLIADNTEIYTSKKQSHWELNITKNDIFSDFIYILKLPKGSAVNYIDPSGPIQIEAEDDNLVIHGSGKNVSFSLVVQYKINKVIDESSSLDWNVIYIFVFLICVVFIYLVYTIFQGRKKTLVGSDEELDKPADFDFKGLSSRQKMIMKLLIDSNKALTQAEIQKELDIPKAAVSRNIHSLEIKGLIEIEKIGMSNLIRLKKP